jgi:hypothetical protein
MPTTQRLSQTFTEKSPRKAGKVGPQAKYASSDGSATLLKKITRIYDLRKKGSLMRKAMWREFSLKYRNTSGAEEGTRTPTPLRVHGPEPCASANSATSASNFGQPEATLKEETTPSILARRELSVKPASPKR